MVRLGIDFGTSSTVATMVDPLGRAHTLRFDASPLLPSGVLARPGRSEILTGADAERAAADHPAGFEANPKRRIDDGTVWLGERAVPVPDLIGAVFDRIAAEAVRIAGRKVGETTLTHPAAWGRHRLDVLAEAAARAGLPKVGFVPEPVAAAAYLVHVLGHAVSTGRTVVVCDLGAGTVDVSVVRPYDTGFAVLAHGSVADVDLDAVVVQHARKANDAWRRLDWPRDPADVEARRALWRAARAARERLSRHPSADLRVLGDTVRITREELERLATPVIERIVALTLDIGQRPDTVFLVGGLARMPMVATALHRALGAAPIVAEQPDLAISEGCLDATTVAAPMSLFARPVIDLGEPPPLDEPVPRRISRRVALGVGSTAAVATAAAVAAALLDGAGRSSATLAVPDAEPAKPVTGARLLGRVAAHDGHVQDLAFSRNGALLATGGRDATAKVWNVATRAPVGQPKPGDGPVVAVAFGPSDALLLVAAPTAVRVWNTQTLATVDVKVGPNPVNDAALSRFGETIITAQQGEVRFHDRVGRPLTTLEISAGATPTIGLSNDGQKIATADGSNDVALWDVFTALQSGPPLHVDGYRLDRARFSPTGTTVLTVGSGGAALWDTASHTQIRKLENAHSAPVTGGTFSRDGDMVATIGADQQIVLWSTGTGQPIGAPLAAHSAAVTSVAFSQDGKTFATGDDTGFLCFWELTR